MLGTGPALELLKEDLADPTSDRVLEVLILAQERGGAIVREILDDLVAATTRDLKLLDEIDTEGLEMRINARAVMVLPWLVLVALTARPGAFRDFYRSPGGVVTLVLAGVLTAVGVVALGRLGREPVEARPFATAGPAVTRGRVPRGGRSRDAARPRWPASLVPPTPRLAPRVGPTRCVRAACARVRTSRPRRPRPRPVAAALLARLFGPPLLALVARGRPVDEPRGDDSSCDCCARRARPT